MYHLRDHSRQLIQSSHRCQLLELWPRRHSVITLLRLPTRSQPGARLTPEGKILRSRRVLLRWCRLALSMARPMRMPVLISNSSWSSAILLLPRVYHKMQSGSVCFRSLSWGERSNGFMLTSLLLWQNHLNYPGSSAQAIIIKATTAQTHFKRNNSWSVE